MQKFNLSQLKKLTYKGLVNNLVLRNEQDIEYLFFKKCNSMFNYILTKIFSKQFDKEKLIYELYLHFCKNNWMIVGKFEERSKFTSWLSLVKVRFFLKKKSDNIDSSKMFAYDRFI